MTDFSSENEFEPCLVHDNDDQLFDKRHLAIAIIYGMREGTRAGRDETRT